MEIKIEPLYKIGDNLQVVSQRQDGRLITYMKVQSIETQTTYIGTVIFYVCRGYLIDQCLIKGIRQGYAISQNQKYAVQKMREDELEKVTQVTEDMINGLSGDKYENKKDSKNE